MSTWLNGSIQPQFRTIDGLSIRFAESDDRQQSIALGDVVCVPGSSAHPLFGE